VIAGVSEFTTAAAVDCVRDAERLGADGLMMLRICCRKDASSALRANTPSS
jgi:dihydrodipicolinate synthase/N-acetylneuraminate lyase